MSIIGHYANELVSYLTQLCSDARTELIFFCLAIVVHGLFFSKLKITDPKKMVDPGSGPKQKKPDAVSEAKFSALKTAMRSNDLQAALNAFEALKSLWQQHDSPSSGPHALLEQFVKFAAKEDALARVLQLSSKMRVLSKVFDMVLNTVAELGDAQMLKEAEELARAQGVVFTEKTYKALLKGTSSCGTLKDSQRVMAEATKAGMVDLATYFIYMKALLKKNNHQEVRGVIENMRAARLQPDTISFNGLIGAAIQSCTFDVAWGFVHDMNSFDVKADQVTCSILLKSITSKARPSELEKVMVLLEDIHGEVDEVLLNSVVEASVRVGRPDLLVSFLERHAIKGSNRTYTAHTYGSIIRAYGYVSDAKGAWDIWTEMRRQHVAPISVTLGCMVEALVTNDDIEGGLDLIHEMQADPKTSSLVNAVMYGSIVKGLSHKKCFDRVWEVYDEMLKQELKFSMVTYNTLIDACARSGDLARIPALLKDVESQGLKMGVVTYSAIVKGYCQKNRLDEAFELVENMPQNTGIEPDEIMYNTLLDGCARQGLYDRGMTVLDKMQASGVRPSSFTLSVLVKLASRAKRIEKAFELCEELSSKYGFRLNIHVYANLIQACVNFQDVPRAISVLERSLFEGVKPDVRSYSLLLRACIDLRQPVEAAGLLRSAAGLSDPHPRLARFAGQKTQPQGGLPGDLVSEVLLGIMDKCGKERVASALFVQLSRVPNLKLDPKLRLRFLQSSNMP